MITIIDNNNNTNSRNQMKAPRVPTVISSSYLQEIPVVGVVSKIETQDRRRTISFNTIQSFQGQSQNISQNPNLHTYLPNDNPKGSNILMSSNGFSRRDFQNPSIVKQSALPSQQKRTASQETAVVHKNFIPSSSQQQLLHSKTSNFIKNQQLPQVLSFPVNTHKDNASTFQSLQRRSSNGTNSHQDISQQQKQINCINYPRQQQSQSQFQCNLISNQKSSQQQKQQQQQQQQQQQYEQIQQQQMTNMKVITCSSDQQINPNKNIMDKRPNLSQIESVFQLKQQQQQPQGQQHHQLFGLQPKDIIEQIPAKQSSNLQQEFEQQQIKAFQHEMYFKDMKTSLKKQIINQSLADQVDPFNSLDQNDCRQTQPNQMNSLNSKIGKQYEQQNDQKLFLDQKDTKNHIIVDKQSSQLQYELLRDYSFSDTKQTEQLKERYSQIRSTPRDQKEKSLTLKDNKCIFFQQEQHQHDHLKQSSIDNHDPKELIQRFLNSEEKVIELQNEIEQHKQFLIDALIEGEIHERKALEVETMKYKLRLEHERLKEEYAILKDNNNQQLQNNQNLLDQLEKHRKNSGMIWPVQQSGQKYDLKSQEIVNGGNIVQDKLFFDNESNCQLIANHQKFENGKVIKIKEEQQQQAEQENQQMDNYILQLASFLEEQESSSQLVADFLDISLLKEIYYDHSQRPLSALPNQCSISSCSDSEENLFLNNNKQITSPSAIFRIEGDSLHSTLFSQLNESQFSMPLTSSGNLPMFYYHHK